MPAFTELEKGTFEKNGKEYDYTLEIAEDFPKKKAGNVRLRITEERPAIRKIRTRYDPDISIYGDKNASLEISLGYDMKEIKKALRRLLFTIISPFYFTGVILLMINMDKIPRSFFSPLLVWLVVSAGLAVTILFFRFYYKLNMMMLAEYFKARDLKQQLDKGGFRQ